jgi:hypothetical protein
VLNYAHFGLALTGLLVWISYLATGVTGLAWAACGLLLAVASLGMTAFAYRDNGTKGTDLYLSVKGSNTLPPDPYRG